MAVACKQSYNNNETLKKTMLVAAAGSGEERSKCSRRKLQDSTNKSKELE